MNVVFFYLTFFVAALTAVACCVRSSRQLILILFVQAAGITGASLILVLVEATAGWNTASIVKIVVAVGELFFAAVLTPFILYIGMRKTKNVSDQPKPGIVLTLAIIAIVTFTQFFLWVLIWPSVPQEFVIFMPVALALSIDFVLIATRDDPLKILVALNIAETSLFTFLEQVPFAIILPLLVLVSLVNLVGVYIIYQGYQQFDSLSVTEWRQAI